MLYKKYHRNYIRQFKKGAKIIYKNSLQYEVVEIVIKEPFIVENKVIGIGCNMNLHRLISPNGKLEQHIINVIQKKYHRNFVKQFKKGVKIKSNDLLYEDTIVREPFIFWDGVICVECEKSRHRLIPFYDGKLNIGVYVV